MKSLRSTKLQIASVVIGVFSCIYAIIQGIFFGFLIALFVGIGEGLGGTASWLTADTMVYLGLVCIIMAVVDLLGVIVTAKAPRAGGIILCIPTAYIIAFGVVFCIFAGGQAGAVAFALGSIILHLAATVLAFMAAKNRTVTAHTTDTVNTAATASLEAGDAPIETTPIPMDPTTTIERGTIPLERGTMPFDATDSLGAINAGKGTATLNNDMPLPDGSPLPEEDE